MDYEQISFTVGPEGPPRFRVEVETPLLRRLIDDELGERGRHQDVLLLPDNRWEEIKAWQNAKGADSVEREFDSSVQRLGINWLETPLWQILCIIRDVSAGRRRDPRFPMQPVEPRRVLVSVDDARHLLPWEILVARPCACYRNILVPVVFRFAFPRKVTPLPKPRSYELARVLVDVARFPSLSSPESPATEDEVVALAKWIAGVGAHPLGSQVNTSATAARQGRVRQLALPGKTKDDILAAMEDSEDADIQQLLARARTGQMLSLVDDDDCSADELVRCTTNAVLCAVYPIAWGAGTVATGPCIGFGQAAYRRYVMPLVAVTTLFPLGVLRAASVARAVTDAAIEASSDSARPAQAVAIAERVVDAMWRERRDGKAMEYPVFIGNLHSIPVDLGLRTQLIQLPEYECSGMPWFEPRLPEMESVGISDLGPDAKADALLITATDTELNQVLQHLKPPESREKVCKIARQGATYYWGKYGVLPAVVTMCSMGAGGPSGATLATREAIEQWKVCAVIMIGIAFGADAVKQKPADVLIADEVIPYENQRIGEHRLQYRSKPLPAGPTLVNRFRNAMNWIFSRPDQTRVARHIGPLLSGEKLIDSPRFKNKLLRQFRGAIGGEMEGYGVASAAVRAKIEWILVKGVCDWADGRKNDAYQPMAAAAAASLVEHVLSERNVLDGLGGGPGSTKS